MAFCGPFEAGEVLFRGFSQLFVKFMRRECEHQQCTTRGEGGGHSFISKLCLTTPREGNKVAAFCLLASCLRCCRCFFGSLLRFFLCFYILLLVFMRVINTRTRTPAHTQRHARQRHTDRHKKSLHTFLGCGELRAKHIRRGNLYVPICPVCV